jgi:hypothetical protein
MYVFHVRAARFLGAEGARKALGACTFSTVTQTKTTDKTEAIARTTAVATERVVGRVSQFISRSGVCSRREAERMMHEGVCFVHADPCPLCFATTVTGACECVALDVHLFMYARECTYVVPTPLVSYR